MKLRCTLDSADDELTVVVDLYPLLSGLTFEQTMALLSEDYHQMDPVIRSLVCAYENSRADVADFFAHQKRIEAKCGVMNLSYDEEELALEVVCLNPDHIIAAHGLSHLSAEAIAFGFGEFLTDCPGKDALACLLHYGYDSDVFSDRFNCGAWEGADWMCDTSIAKSILATAQQRQEELNRKSQRIESMRETFTPITTFDEFVRRAHALSYL